MIVPVIVGPTGSGKTAIAEILADSSYPFEVISLDSRQVYNHMPVGTAQPSDSLQKRIPHHLVGFLSPLEKWDAQKNRMATYRALDQITARNSIPVVIGGTGFYLRALETEPFAVKISNEIRNAVQSMTPQQRIEKLESIEPSIFLRPGQQPQKGRIHRNDSYRIVRALEIAMSGQSYSDQWDLANLRQSNDSSVQFKGYHIQIEKEPYWNGLQIRCKNMIGNGLIEEAVQVREWFGVSCAGLETLGYKEALQCADGKLSGDELLERLFILHRQYGKKQRTWFRHQHQNLTGVGFEFLYRNACDLVLRLLNQNQINH